MRLLPILFNTDMVRAILDGRKTVTRRILKLPKRVEKQDNGLYTLFTEGTSYENQHLEEIIDYIKPQYQPGDILYVRETWCVNPNIKEYYYKANRNNGVEAPYGLKWHPSIHMPKEAARIWLRVTDVRVERLQDIKNVHDEGIRFYDCPAGYTWKPSTDMHNCYTEPMGAMKALWNSTIKKSDHEKYEWNANPWVWVIEFERCEKPVVAGEENCNANDKK